MMPDLQAKRKKGQRGKAVLELEQFRAHRNEQKMWLPEAIDKVLNDLIKSKGVLPDKPDDGEGKEDDVAGGSAKKRSKKSNT